MKRYNKFAEESSDAGVSPKTEEQMDEDDRWLFEGGPCPNCGSEKDYLTTDCMYNINSCPDCSHTSIR